MSPTTSHHPVPQQKMRKARACEVGLIREVQRSRMLDAERLRLRLGCACLLHGYLLLEHDVTVATLARIAGGRRLN